MTCPDGENCPCFVAGMAHGLRMDSNRRVWLDGLMLRDKAVEAEDEYFKELEELRRRERMYEDDGR